MASRHVFLLIVAAQSAAAQTDLLGTIISAAESFVTSVFAPRPTTSSSSSTTSSTSTTSSSSSVTSTTASPSQTAAASSPTSSSTSSAAAAEASRNSASTGSGGSNTLAIVLGCTLGALAIAAFLALCFFCRRRRQRSKRASKHHALSANDDETETWHHEKPRVRSLKEPTSEVRAVGNTREAAPLTHGRSFSNHQNPFVPVPPPARRSMHNGLHDNTAYSAHPYRPEDVSAYQPGMNPETAHGHDANHALADAAGGAILGGAAARAVDHHDRKRSLSRGRATNMSKSDHRFSEDEHNALPEAAVASRRSGSVSRASVKEPWPFMDPNGRKSSESARTANRGLHSSHDRFSTPNQYPVDEHHGHSKSAMAGAAAAGGLAGAAVAHHKSKSRSPHRKGILKQTTSDSSDPSSLTNSSSLATEDYLPSALSKSSSRPISLTGPHELATSERPTIENHARGHHNHHDHNADRIAAPLAAAVATDEVTSRHRRSGSEGSHHILPPLAIPHEESAPIIPSRSPKRTSLDHSRARYSTANEGTAELPSQNATISPSMEATRSTENDGLLSPVSPITESQTGSWSKVQAANTGLGIADSREKTSSQESTVVSTSTPHEVAHSEAQSSGLVSAIQRIFNSGKSVPDDHEALVGNPDQNDIQANREKRLRNVPHRKPAPDRASHQPISQYGDIAHQQQLDSMPGAWDNTPNRRSGDSARSLPPRYRSRGNSFNNNVDGDFVPASVDGNRQRSHSRPGYGLGSGDPFDLARVRTDSSMTGISLSNYQEPVANAGRPRAYRKSSGSDYKGPSLADLRREVVAEDRHRAQHAWRASHPHFGSNSAGMRYGDDKDLFNMVDQTTGNGRYYATTPQDRRGSMGGNVGRAY